MQNLQYAVVSVGSTDIANMRINFVATLPRAVDDAIVLGDSGRYAELIEAHSYDIMFVGLGDRTVRRTGLKKEAVREYICENVISPQDILLIAGQRKDAASDLSLAGRMETE